MKGSFEVSKFWMAIAALLIAAPAAAQAPACWPKDLAGGTGSAAVAVQAPLASGAVREAAESSCAVAWTCTTTYERSTEIAVFRSCSAPVEQLRQSALAALAEARATPAWAALVLARCEEEESDHTLALCRQARDAIAADKSIPKPPAFAASEPGLVNASGTLSKELAAVPGAACACDDAARRRLIKGELRCELASSKAPDQLYAACERR